MEDQELSPYARERFSELATEWARLRRDFSGAGKHDGIAKFGLVACGFAGLILPFTGPQEGETYFSNAFTSGAFVAIAVFCGVYLLIESNKQKKLSSEMSRVESAFRGSGFAPNDDGTFSRR